MADEATAIEENLADLRTALATDGYRLTVADVGPNALSLDIEALADACPDCLVPSTVMELIVRAAIPDDGRFATIAIAYPADSVAHG